MQATRGRGGGSIYGEWWLSAALKLYCQSYRVLQKILEDTSFPYITAVLPVLYLLTLARPIVQFKVHGINTELKCVMLCTVISVCIHPCDTNNFNHSLTIIHLLQLKIHDILMNVF